MGDVKAKPLLDTLPDNLRQAKAEINFHKVAKTLQEAESKTPLVTLDYMKAEILIHTLVDTVGKHESETHANTSRKGDANSPAEAKG